MKPLQNLFYFKLAIFKSGGKAMIAGVLSVAATLNGADWSQFTSTQKFLAIAAALGAMWTVVDAFLDNTMSDLRDEKPAADAAQEVADAKIAAAVPVKP